MEINVFTDGSCLKKEGKEPKCGYGIYFPNGEIEDESNIFYWEPLTNQRAELYAILRALKKIIEKYPIFNKITVYTDSEYSIKSLTEWINDWKKNGWKTKNNKPVKNLDIILKIDEIMTKYTNKIKLVHIRAHQKSDDPLTIANNKVDILAKHGAEKGRKKYKL